MDPHELSRIQKALQAINDIQKLRQVIDSLQNARQARDFIDWLSRNKEHFKSFPEEELERVREKAQYDEEQWRRILKQLES